MDFNQYLNPLARLGIDRYSSKLPLAATLGAIVILVLVTGYPAIGNGPAGIIEILTFIILVVYFSFRDGVLGGSIVTLLGIMYHAVAIYSRGYKGDELVGAENLIAILGAVYLLITAIIGWLKQKTDELINLGREGERRLKTIVEQLPVGIIVRNKKGQIEMTNKHAAKILNLRPSDIQSLFSKLTKTNKPIVGQEYVIKKKDGRISYIHASAVTICNNSNQTIGSAAIFTDVTKLKEVEQRKDDFINMASHELKTPITSMRLYLDLLSAEMQSMDTEKRHIVNSIRLQTKRLQKLANDLVDVSRLQTGKFTFDKTRFALDKLIEETLSDLEGAANERKIIFAKRRPIFTTADQFRIYQVLTNIVTNALKYSPPKSPVYVKLSRKDSEAVISVQDFGVGIAREEQKKIFERLYQVTSDKQNTFPGLGMGLYISKEIIKRHMGRIWVKSEKGKGSTFYFSLPII